MLLLAPPLYCKLLQKIVRINVTILVQTQFKVKCVKKFYESYFSGPERYLNQFITYLAFLDTREDATEILG